MKTENAAFCKKILKIVAEKKTFDVGFSKLLCNFNKWIQFRFHISSTDLYTATRKRVHPDPQPCGHRFNPELAG
jgi:hypothetical protein